MQQYKLHFDGSCSPKNPGGTAAFGYALFKAGIEKSIDTGSGVIGEGPGMTNNLAEFYALAKGLESFYTLMQAQVEKSFLSVQGDSKLVIQMMNGHWRPDKEKAYYAGYDAAITMLRNIRFRHTVTFDWIPREKNTLCDDLSKAHQK
jgi:ribonuclease HI